MTGHWQIRYHGMAKTGMASETLAALKDYLVSSSDLPGLQPPASSWPARLLFRGELQVVPGDSSREVMTLLDTLNDLERRYPGLLVVVADSLEMLRRHEDGHFHIELDVDDDADDDDFGFGGEGLGDDELGSEDPFGWEPSAVFDGPDPGVPPFADGPMVAMGPSQPVDTEAHVRTESWVLEGLGVSRRPAIDGQGYEYIVSGEIALVTAGGGEVAHLVDADVALLGGSGEVLAAETVLLGYDVHQRGELWLTVSLPSDLAERVVRIEVGLDAYYRMDRDVAHWERDTTLAVNSADGLLVECAFRRVDWPLPSFEVVGRIGNETGAYLASVELALEAFDDIGDLLSDDDDHLGMTGPGEERPFRLQAPLGFEESPRLAVLRARVAARRREALCTLLLR